MTKFMRVVEAAGPLPLDTYVVVDLPNGGYKRTYKSGSYSYYDKDSRFHREDGPAIYDPVKKFEMWYLHGKLHNTKGLAQRSWGAVPELAPAYFVNGNLFTSEEFHKHFGDDK